MNKEDPKHSVARGTQYTVSVNRGNDIPTEIDLSIGQQEPTFLDCYMEIGQEALDTEEESFFDTFSGLKGTDIHEGQDEDGCFYFNMIESMPAKQHIGKAFHLTIDYDYVNEYMVPQENIIDDMLRELSTDDLLGMNEYFDTYAFAI